MSVPNFRPDGGLLPAKLLFAVPVALAAWTLGDFFVWLLRRDFGDHRLLSVGLCLGVLALPLYHVFLSWYFVFRFRRRAIPPPTPGRTVDVFVTAFDEPVAMVEETLAAALRIRYPHRTLLLDDGNRPELAAVAERLGTLYLAREGNEHHKAGNVNHALRRTDGELVAIFDVDHRPEPGFLDRTVGLFDDPRLGFVQTMLTFGNQGDGLLSRAAAQTAYEYYNLAAVGKDRLGGAGLMGSNAVIRRRALETIGLYRPGLAEDLETSLALHAAGWRSAYVREPLAPGHAPNHLPGFLKQQLKWSNGVFEAALGSFLDGRFFRLGFRRKLCYLARFSYYLLGALVFVNMAAVAVALFWSGLDVEALTRHLLPFSAFALLARFAALRLFALEPEARSGFLLAGTSLVASSWPVYLLAAASVAARRRLPFLPTPKEASARLPAWSYLPQLAMVALLLGGVLFRLGEWPVRPLPATVATAALLIGSQWMLFATLTAVLFERPAKMPGSKVDDVL
jgi:cellulose synthase (UDP-forming)